MNIDGKIIGIKYKPFLCSKLSEIEIDNFDINTADATSIVKTKRSAFTISKWVSPKRTRSYPFARVYNSLASSKKITVIPVIKDEGLDGDRDYIQWDTVSLMSLLDVFVIFAYYVRADVNPRYKNKITNQQFDNDYVLSKINEIENYHSSSLHWNLNELQTNFKSIIEKTKRAYDMINKTTNVIFHNNVGINNLSKKIGNDVSTFINFSRDKAKMAQDREVKTIQPKEMLLSQSKSKITIKNYLGGAYFLTADEVKIKNNILYLIESKYSKTSVIPSVSDIKDGLLTMILFSNLKEVYLNNKKINSKAVLKLDSKILKGRLVSDCSEKLKELFFENNNFNTKQKHLLQTLFQEAITNNFIVIVEETK